MTRTTNNTDTDAPETGDRWSTWFTGRGLPPGAPLADPRALTALLLDEAGVRQ
jgi:hypothetical protein